MVRRDLLGDLLPLARALRKIEDVAAASEALSMWQYAVLAAVHDDTLNQTQLATRLQYSKNRLVHDIDHLETRLLVRRVADHVDLRSNCVTLTPAGNTVRRRIQRRIHAAEDELLSHLSSRHREQFGAMVERASAAVRPTLSRPS